MRILNRHANSPTAVIRLWREDDDVWLEIADAGRGIPPDRLQALQKPFTGMGVGISGMRERLRLLGGRLKLQNQASGGLFLQVEIPHPRVEDVALEMAIS